VYKYTGGLIPEKMTIIKDKRDSSHSFVALNEFALEIANQKIVCS